MTNREYLETLTPYEFAQWALYEHPYNLKINSAFEVGSACTSSVDGLAQWLNEEYHEVDRNW